VHNYLGLQHEYGKVDCIQLVKLVYADALSIDIELPEYEPSKRWSALLPIDYIDAWALKYAKKVDLTSAKNFDLLVFSNNKKTHIVHFGLYISPNKMLHIEESGCSKIESLSCYWEKDKYVRRRYGLF
jgi:cell wall-associated NlpC family hydrolase